MSEINSETGWTLGCMEHDVRYQYTQYLYEGTILKTHIDPIVVIIELKIRMREMKSCADDG